MATITSAQSGNWGDVATWVGGAVPVDGDAVIIAEGHAILMNVDQSAFVTGIDGLTITGSVGTPGMLYFKDGTDGYLMMKTGTKIQGTSTTYFGRLLANSDGVWGSAGSLAYANKAVIALQGSAQIDGSYLDIRLYCYQPTHKYVTTYKFKKTVQSVDVDTNVITLTEAHGMTSQECIFLRSSGTLPEPLVQDMPYFLISTGSNTLKICLYPYNAELNLTSAGSGTIEIYYGYVTYAGVTTVNVIEDVSAETGWDTTDGHDHVGLFNHGSPNPNFQKQQLTTINAESIVLSTALDSKKNAGSRLYLVSRNVSIRLNVSGYSPAITNGKGHVLQCEIRNAYGTPGNFNATGISYALECVMSGVLAYFYTGVNGGNGSSMSGNMLGCGLVSCTKVDITGHLVGAYTAMSDVYGVKMSGTIFGCSMVYGAKAEESITTGYVIGNGYIYYSQGRHLALSAKLFANMSNMQGNCCFANFRNMAPGCSGIPLAVGTPYKNNRITHENYNGIDGAMKIEDQLGNILKTLCDGTGDAPSIDPDMGNDYCLEASNIQACLTPTVGPLKIINGVRLWVRDGERTIEIPIQTTYASIAAGGLILRVQYVDVNGAITEITNAPAIAQRSDATDWSQYLRVTFTQGFEGWVTIYVELTKYESGNEVYVWPITSIL